MRIVLDDDSGLDVTEAGTKKSYLAMYLAATAFEVPGTSPASGPTRSPTTFTPDVLHSILASEGGRKQIKGVLRHQGTIAGIGNAYSDREDHRPVRPRRGTQRRQGHAVGPLGNDGRAG